MADRNPLTGLPGNRTIREVLDRRVLAGGGTAAYVDIVNFKPFNDHYGFALGDAVIRRLATILAESVPGDFTGHIGGDDFICVGNGDPFRKAVSSARQRFRSVVPGFYTRRDREQGGIETFDRSGSYRFFPLLDVSLVFVDGKDCHTVEALAAAAGRAKKGLKGEHVPEPVWPVLEALLQGDYSPGDAKTLIEACGVLREEAAVPLLRRILEGSYSWKMRKSAALALGRTGTEQGIEALVTSLKDSNPHVRTRSVQGLVLAMGQRAGPVVMPLAFDGSTWVRRAVFRGIGHAGWSPGAEVLKTAATAIAPGRTINTREERRAALEGLGMLGESRLAPFLHGLCRDSSYHPAETAYYSLCALGTDLAAVEIIRRGRGLPPAVNLSRVGDELLHELEKIAERSMTGTESETAAALRFLEGFPVSLDENTVTELRRALGSFSGELFRRLVLLLDSRGITADPSCVARVAERTHRGHAIGDRGLSAFLHWVASRGGVPPESLLNTFIRSSRRAVAVSAAVTAAKLAERGLDAKGKELNNKKPEE